MKRRLTGISVVCGAEVPYWLVKDLSPSGGDTYGFAVEREGERAEYRDLSPMYQDVFDLLKTLARCGVTPVTAGDIVEDWLLR